MGQPGSTQIELKQQVKNQWGGWQPAGTVQDICAACAKDLGYRGLAKELSQAELDDQAEEIRDTQGGPVIRGQRKLPWRRGAEAVDDRDQARP